MSYSHFPRWRKEFQPVVFPLAIRQCRSHWFNFNNKKYCVKRGTSTLRFAHSCDHSQSLTPHRPQPRDKTSLKYRCHRSACSGQNNWNIIHSNVLVCAQDDAIISDYTNVPYSLIRFSSIRIHGRINCSTQYFMTRVNGERSSRWDRKTTLMRSRDFEVKLHTSIQQHWFNERNVCTAKSPEITLYMLQLGFSIVNPQHPRLWWSSQKLYEASSNILTSITNISS